MVGLVVVVVGLLLVGSAELLVGLVAADDLLAVAAAAGGLLLRAGQVQAALLQLVHAVLLAAVLPLPELPQLLAGSCPAGFSCFLHTVQAVVLAI